MSLLNWLVVLPLTVMAVFAFGFMIYAVIAVNSRSRKHKMLKDNGMETTGKITHIVSRSGGNSGYVNVTISAAYINQATNQQCNGKGDAVIEVTKLADYQPGKNVQLIYNDKKPELIFMKNLTSLMEKVSNNK